MTAVPEPDAERTAARRGTALQRMDVLVREREPHPPAPAVEAARA